MLKLQHIDTCTPYCQQRRRSWKDARWQLVVNIRDSLARARADGDGGLQVLALD